jgi:PadR family transcriptional regulator, regulatory protein AphA
MTATRISRTDAAILGMLTVEPMSGYDMKRFCDQSLAHFWHESYGNLYPRLKRLKAAGLVSAREERRERAPDATVYSLTAAGRRRFLAWLREEPEPEQVRSEFMLKVFFGSHAGPELCAERIRAYREHQEAVRVEYGRIEAMVRKGLAERPEVPYWLMSLRRGQLLNEARLRWSDECLDLIEDTDSEEAS